MTSDTISTKSDASNSDSKIDKLTRQFNIKYRACIGSLIHLLSKRVDLSFSIHKLEKLSPNPGKVHFEGLVHLLISIRDNETLGLNYYSDMNDSPLYDLFRQASIKTENQLVDFSNSS